MKFENTSVYNIYNAILGGRNPLESWNKSDTVFKGYNGKIENTVIGENDMKLARQLIKAGSEHRKFLRQIFISVDITAPLYWWKEFSTYKVGTVSNSCSTMHKLASTPITLDCFETDDVEILDVYNYELSVWWDDLIGHLEALRTKYNETKDKRYWKELIRLLPESWLQKRTITINYENLYSMMKQRKHHKLTEWSKDFMEWAENLPYVKELFND